MVRVISCLCSCFSWLFLWWSVLNVTLSAPLGILPGYERAWSTAGIFRAAMRGGWAAERNYLRNSDKYYSACSRHIRGKRCIQMYRSMPRPNRAAGLYRSIRSSAVFRASFFQETVSILTSSLSRSAIRPFLSRQNSATRSEKSSLFSSCGTWPQSLRMTKREFRIALCSL